MLRAIADFCIDHPPLIGVLLIVVLIAGAFAASQNPIESMPDITIPVVIVTVPYPGVGPEEMEAEITKELEEALATLEDLDYIESWTSEGLSTIVITFVAGGDLDEAVDEIQKTVDRVKTEFPEDALDPTVTELNFSNLPIVQVTVAGGIDPCELKATAEFIESEIKRIDGIGNTVMYGGIDRELTVAVDAGRLTAISRPVK